MADRDSLTAVETKEAWTAWRAKASADGATSDTESLFIKDAPSESRALWSKDDVAEYMKGADPEVIERAVEKFEGGEGKGATIAATISDESVDRDGDTISPKGVQHDHFDKNPVVLGFHNGGVPPVGKSNGVFLRDDKVKSVTQFNDADLKMDGFVDGYVLGQMYERGFMNAFSIGFMGLKFEFNEERKDAYGFPGVDFKEAELYEYSPVTIPSNRNALAEARAAGIDVASFKSWAERVLDEGGQLVLPRSAVEQIHKDAQDGATIYSLGIVDGALKMEAAPPQTIEELVTLVESRGFGVTLTRGVEAPVVEPEIEPEPVVEDEPAGISADTIRDFFKMFSEKLDRTAGEPIRTTQTSITGRLPD
jgi:hypothetical protein